MKKFLAWYTANWQAKLVVWLGLLVIIFWFSFFSFLLVANQRIDLDTVKQTVYPTHGSDSEQYTILAENIRINRTFSLDQNSPFKPDGFRTIGYPGFIALWKSLFHSYLAVIVVQFFLLWGTAFLVYRIALKLGLGIWSIMPAAMVMFDPAALFYSFFLLSDTLFNFLLVLSFWLLVLAWSTVRQKQRGYFLVTSGCVLGLAVLVRPIAIFLPVVYLVAIGIMQGIGSVRKLLWDGVCLLVSFTVVVSFWMMRNHTVFNTWQLSSVGPVTFFEFTVPEFLAQKQGSTIAQVRNEFHRKIGMATTTDLVIDMVKTPAMMSVVVDALRTDYLEYFAFHTYKTLPFFYTSSLKIFIVGTEPFRSNELLRTIISVPRFSEIKALSTWSGWLVVFGQVLFLLERFFWFIVSVLAIVSVYIVRKQTAVRWAIVNFLFIGYFAFLTGPVANERYRLPAVPFMALNLTLVVVYWYNQRRLDKMPKI